MMMDFVFENADKKKKREKKSVDHET